jgi:hypothetical protein
VNGGPPGKGGPARRGRLRYRRAPRKGPKNEDGTSNEKDEHQVQNTVTESTV